MADAVARFSKIAGEIGSLAARDFPDLWAADAVPAALWAKMADAGLFGLSTPTRYGGAGMTVDEIARVARVFVRAAGVQGLSTVWTSHNLMADWIFGHFANAAQQAAWSPKIATGEASLAFAVSEPGAGAHPKKLATTATADGDGFRLNGRKAYVTNGPIAAVFCLVAVVDTGPDGRKRFGAFLVPADADGLTVRPSEHVDYLKPSGHASLELNDVFAPAAARLTDADDVYPVMVRPLRDHEDAAGAWARLGAYERLAKALGGTPDLHVVAGGVAARLRVAALALEQDPSPEGLLGVRAILGDVRREIGAAVATHPNALSDGDAALERDLAKLIGVARYAVDARFAALGRSL